jgi:hypothetical protein
LGVPSGVDSDVVESERFQDLGRVGEASFSVAGGSLGLGLFFVLEFSSNADADEVYRRLVDDFRRRIFDS